MTEKYSLWDELKSTDKPIIIYGTGNGADKIFDVLEACEITPSDVFASDGFVRDRMFRGYHVLSYSDIINKYGNEITVLVAFGTVLPDVISFIRELDSKHDLLVPDVPLYGGDLFDYGYFTDHNEMLKNAASLLSDERSMKLFNDAVDFRLTGKLKYLDTTDDIKETLKTLFSGKKIKSVIDGGAFKGDSTELFCECFSPEIIYAVEADRRTYIKLEKYVEGENRTKVVPVCAALSNKDGITSYISSSSRGSGEQGRNRRSKLVSVDEKTIDSILNGEKIDFIKLDVEGAEKVSLEGAKQTIKNYQPDLAVSLYHRTDDLYELIEYVHKVLPSHKLYLRRVPCIPLWDLVLYAIK